MLGWAEFCGLRIAVDPGVFVPRRRTEFLAGQAIRLARPGAVVLDLCCGSGALAAALAAAVDRAEVHAADIDPAAVRCARRNLAAAGGHVYQGDLFAPLPPGLRGRVDILLANVPYVPTGEVGLLPPEARDYEARVALDGGADGLGVLRRVAAGRAGVAGAGRASAVRDQRAPGGRGHRGRDRRRAGRPGGPVRRARGHGPGRHLAAAGADEARGPGLRTRRGSLA